MRILAITMGYNERRNLPNWLKYYQRALGKSGKLLYIDHGSTDGSTDILNGHDCIRIPRSKYSEIERARFVSKLQQAFIVDYDIVIYTDCDEFLVPDPAKYENLEAFLHRFQTEERSCVRAVGLNIFQSLNFEAELFVDMPILAQRSYCQFHSVYCKPLITKVALDWTIGFHDCNVASLIDNDLYLFHTRDIDVTYTLSRMTVTRNLEWTDAEKAAMISGHQRYSDELTLQERFRDPDEILRTRPNFDFDFQAETDKMNTQFSDFKGSVAIIPSRFKRCL